MARQTKDIQLTSYQDLLGIGIRWLVWKAVGINAN